MAGHWCDTTWLQRKYSIRLCGGFLLEYTGGTASRVANLLKTPGRFLTFETEIGLVDELKLCFQRWFIFFKRMWYCTTIISKHDSSASPGFKTIYFQFS
jgi:hypothetical protein